MMKKTLLLLMMVAAAAVFAVPQIANTDDLTFSSNSGGWFDIQSDGALTLTYYSPNSKYGLDTVFGYSVLDANGNEISRTELAVKPNTSVTIDGLKSGDKIAFWVESKKGNFTSLDSGAFVNGTKGNLEYWVVGNGSTEIAFVTGYTSKPSPTPSGAPLPGVAATLLLGGAGLYMLQRKRRKNAVKS